MSAKNQNKQPDWIIRLRQFDEVPHSSAFNKTEAWNKLFLNLEEPERLPRRTWLWLSMAAAFAALLLLVVWMQTSEKTEQHVIHSEAASNSESLNKAAPGISVPATPSTLVKAEKKEKLLFPEPKKFDTSGLKNTPADKIVARSIPIPASKFLEPELTVPPKASVAAPDIISQQPTVISRKKMAIVYLNEIETGSPTQWVQQKKSHNRRMITPKFNATDQDAFAATQQPLFSIKISSSN